MSVTVRPFEDADFEQLKAIIPAEWLCQGCTPRELAAHRDLIVAEELARSPYRMVAEVDGQVLGVTLGCLAGTTPADAERWAALTRQAQDVMRAGSPAARSAEYYEESLGATIARLKEAAGARMGQDNELVLFFVSPASRGKGVGGALVARWEQEVRAAGGRNYYLLTDTTCTYGWYDAHGFVRIAELNEPFPVPEGVEPNDDASFLYRKDL